MAIRDNKGRFVKGHTITEEMREKMRGHGANLIGNTHGFKKGFTPWNKGRAWSNEMKERMSKAHRGKRLGSKNHNWKEKGMTYAALHSWVKRHRGTPDTCEHCGISNTLTGTTLSWANKSQNYERDLRDWIRLCPRCHSEYDKNAR